MATHKSKGIQIKQQLAVRAYSYSSRAIQLINSKHGQLTSYSLLHVGVEELHIPSLHVAKLSPFKT